MFSTTSSSRNLIWGLLIQLLVLLALSDTTVRAQSAAAGAAEGQHNSAADTVQSVGKIRSAAEVALSKGEVDQALQLWEKVIQMEPKNEQNFYKRFRIYLRQQKLKEALADLNSALAIKPEFEAVLVQRSKLNLRLGNCNQAEEDLTKLQRLSPSNKDIELLPQATACKNAVNKAEVFYGRSQWGPARDHLNEAIRYAEGSSSLLYKRAICSFHLGDTYEAIADTGKILKAEADNLLALELRGNSYYVLDELDMAMNHYRQGLKFDPEHDGCKGGYRLIKKLQGFMSKADKALQGRDFEGAIKHLRSAIDIDPEHKFIVPKCTLKVAIALTDLKRFKEAKDEVQKAIDLDARQNQANAGYHLVLGKIHMECDEFDQAIAQFKKAQEIDQENRDIAEELRKAEVALKQSKQKDHYKTLGVNRKANAKEIKKAYRELALQWHPDKHEGEEEKAKAQIEFQKIAEAYEVLSDDEKRGKYDRGEEVEPNQGGGHGGFNPFQHFQQQGFGGFGGGQQHFQFHFG